MGIIFSIVGSIMKYGFYTAGLLIIGIGFFARKTLPSDESFKRYTENLLKADSNNPVVDVLMSAGNNLAHKVINPEFKDYYFVKAVKVPNSRSSYFIGAFSNWIKW